MTERRTEILDEVIEDLRRVLDKCDEAGIAAVSAIYIDLAMNLAKRERDAKCAEVA